MTGRRKQRRGNGRAGTRSFLLVSESDSQTSARQLYEESSVFKGMSVSTSVSDILFCLSTSQCIIQFVLVWDDLHGSQQIWLHMTPKSLTPPLQRHSQVTWVIKKKWGLWLFLHSENCYFFCIKYLVILEIATDSTEIQFSLKNMPFLIMIPTF